MRGVLEVRQDREALEIRATEAEAVLRELLDGDRSISGIEVTSAGLEEAFIALTSEDNLNKRIYGAINMATASAPLTSVVVLPQFSQLSSFT